MYSKKSKKNKKGAPGYWFNAAGVDVFGQSIFANPVSQTSGQSGSSDSAFFGDKRRDLPAGRLVSSINTSSLDPASPAQLTSQTGKEGANQNTPISGQPESLAFKSSGFDCASTQLNTSNFGQASSGDGFFDQQNAANSSILGTPATPLDGFTRFTLDDFLKTFPGPAEKIDTSPKEDKLETYCKSCKLITKENAILRAQIKQIAKFRTSIQGLGQCLDAISPPFPKAVDQGNISPVPVYQKVFGEAENEDSLPTISNNRWLFVTRFTRSVTEDQIRDYMARKLSTKRRPVCIGLTRPQDHPLKAASFKVELQPGEFAEALTPDFWNKGVVASEYRPPINRVTSVSSLVSDLG